jgi:hypothetical protein
MKAIGEVLCAMREAAVRDEARRLQRRAGRRLPPPRLMGATDESRRRTMIGDATNTVEPFGPEYHVDAIVHAVARDDSRMTVTHWAGARESRRPRWRYVDADGRTFHHGPGEWMIDDRSGERYALVER